MLKDIEAKASKASLGEFPSAITSTTLEWVAALCSTLIQVKNFDIESWREVRGAPSPPALFPLHVTRQLGCPCSSFLGRDSQHGALIIPKLSRIQSGLGVPKCRFCNIMGSTIKWEVGMMEVKCGADTLCLCWLQCVVPYLSSFMDEKAAQAISQTFLDQSYEVTQERVKEVRVTLPLYLSLSPPGSPASAGCTPKQRLGLPHRLLEVASSSS